MWKVLTSAPVMEKPSLPTGRRIYCRRHPRSRGFIGRSFRAHRRRSQIATDRRRSPGFPRRLYLSRAELLQVIDLLIARQKGHTVVPLKGNHEDYPLRFLSKPALLSEWKNVGGLNTILSYGVAPPRRLDLQSQHRLATALGHSMPDSHRRFLGGLALSFSCGDFFFVHAGARPGIPFQEQSQNDLLWIREDFLLHEEDFGKVVVHGHTPAREPDICPNRINIDTGAYATGRLTRLVLESDQMSFL